MFEHIHFKKQDIVFPITNRNAENTMPLYFENSDDFINLVHDTHSHDFLIDGSLLSCTHFPVSAYAQKNLFYIQGFNILDTKKNYYTRRKNYDSYLLCITYEGTGILEYDGKTYTLKPGQAFLMDCREEHFYKTAATHWKHADLHFLGSFTQDIFAELKENIIITWDIQGTLQKSLEELIYIYDSVMPYRDFILSNKLETLLISILEESNSYHRNLKGIPENLVTLLHYIDLHYNEHLSLDFLSEFSGINKYHLIRLFKKYLGYTPKEYILQLQLKNAQQFLKTTTLPANKIAAMVGMESENYFSHFFKSRTGMSPGQFRKSNQ